MALKRYLYVWIEIYDIESKIVIGACNIVSRQKINTLFKIYQSNSKKMCRMLDNDNNIHENKIGPLLVCKIHK